MLYSFVLSVMDIWIKMTAIDGIFQDADIIFAFLFAYVVFTTILFFVYCVNLIILVMASFGKSRALKEIDALQYVSDRKLKNVVVMVPLYHEQLTVSQLIKTIASSDYPKDKFVIHCLLEHDDVITQETMQRICSEFQNTIQFTNADKLTVKQFNAWNGVKVVIDIVPPGNFKTKPNALNYGLKKVLDEKFDKITPGNFKADILTVYDAEDRPEPDQLKKMVNFMIKHPETSCTQARLSYYNPHQSYITKFFAMEYIQHFLVLLPTHRALNNVLLLGGTSNFFYVDKLHELGGWDSANVTEDADLGIRLKLAGCNTELVNTITWEEAPPKFHHWLQQRIRWNKGYLQTLFKHFRHPLKLINRIGFVHTFSLFMYLIGPIVSSLSLVNWIFFIIFWLDWCGVSIHVLSEMISAVYAHNWIVFLLTQFTFTIGTAYPIFMALNGFHRQTSKLTLNNIKWAFLTPVYALMQGVSATIAFYEFLSKPTVWNKTPHGFSIVNKNTNVV